MDRIFADQVPPADIPPVSTDGIALEEQVIHAVVVHRGMRLVHPVLVRTAVILGFVRVTGQDVFKCNRFIRYGSGFPVRQGRNFFRRQHCIEQLQLIHQPGKHLVIAGRNLFSVSVFADEQPFIFSRGYLGIREDRHPGCQFTVQVQGHQALFPVKYSCHMVPFIAGQALVIRPQGEPVFVGTRLKAQPAKTLVSQQEALVRSFVILSDNRGQMGISTELPVGIIPLKCTRSHPYADTQGTARYADLFRIIGNAGGAAVEQQRTTLHARCAPLRIHGVRIRRSQELVLNVRFLQMAAPVLNHSTLSFIKGEVQQRLPRRNSLRIHGR